MPSRLQSPKEPPLQSPSQSSRKFIAHSDDLESFSIHQLPMVRLYDIDSTLEISRDVADGYLILLSGGLSSAQSIKQQRNKKKVSSAPTPSGEPSAQSINKLTPEQVNAIHLAFFALTDGNAVDTIFGVKSFGGSRRSKGTSERAFNASNDAKRALMDAAVSSDAIRLLAVETYVKCFEIIVKYHMDLEMINFIARCAKHQKIRDSASKQIEELFHALEEGVASTS